VAEKSKQNPDKVVAGTTPATATTDPTFGQTFLHLVSLLAPGGVFDPEAITVLVAALDRAWASVLTSGAQYSDEKYADAARAFLARYILDAAANGERDPIRLSEGAILGLARSQLSGLGGV
jgi:hypothetical protein